MAKRPIRVMLFNMSLPHTEQEERWRLLALVLEEMCLALGVDIEHKDEE